MDVFYEGIVLYWGSGSWLGTKVLTLQKHLNKDPNRSLYSHSVWLLCSPRETVGEILHLIQSVL